MFRYFSTKEDIICGPYEDVGENIAQQLQHRPLDEAVWVSMQTVFGDVITEAYGQGSALRVTDQIIRSTPVLRASYLEKIDRMQALCVKAVLERAQRRGHPFDQDDPLPAAVIGAAFSCLLSAQSAAIQGADADVERLLRRCMSTLAPRLSF